MNAENEDNFWVCSGTTDIEILSESNPLNAKGYSWHYRITEYNADDEAVTGLWENVGGNKGGKIVFAGKPEEIVKHKKSQTRIYIENKLFS